MKASERIEIVKDAIRFLESPDITAEEKYNIMTSERNILEIPFYVLMEIYKRVCKEWYTRRNMDAAVIDMMRTNEVKATAFLAPDLIMVDVSLAELKDYLRTLG